MNNKYPSLKNQAAWLLSSKVVGFAFGLVLPLIVVRVLTQEEFGLYRMSFLVIMNAVAILPVGIAMSAYYYLARDESKRAAAVLNIVLVHFIVGAIAFLLLVSYPELLGLIFNNEQMTHLAPLIGIAVWLWLFSFFLEHAAVANREPRHAAFFIVFAQISKTILMAGFVLSFGSVESIIWAAIIQAGIQTLILLAYLSSRFPNFWKNFELGFFKEHLNYAVPFGIAGILFTVQMDLHYYFVSYRFGEVAYAIYAIGCFQLPLIAILTESVTAVMIPRMSELQRVNDTKEMVRVTVLAMQKLAFIFFPTYVFLYVMADTFITTLFTHEYAESIPIFLIFLTLVPVAALICDPVVRAYEDLGRFLVKLRIATSFVLIVGLYFGIRYFDMRGVIAVVVIIRVFEKILIQFVVFRTIGLKLGDIKLLRDFGIPATVSVFSGIVTYLVHEVIQLPIAQLTLSLATNHMTSPNDMVIEFVSGVAILAVCLLSFVTVYLTAAYFAGNIDDSGKELIRRVYGKIFARRAN